MEYVGSIITPDPNAPAGDVGGAGPLTVQGLPLLKPPWGRITAIDLNAGEIAWQVPHGATPDHVRDHPQLQGMTYMLDGRQFLVVAVSGGGQFGELIAFALPSRE